MICLFNIFFVSFSNIATDDNVLTNLLILLIGLIIFILLQIWYWPINKYTNHSVINTELYCLNISALNVYLCIGYLAINSKAFYVSLIFALIAISLNAAFTFIIIRRISKRKEIKKSLGRVVQGARRFIFGKKDDKNETDNR